MRIDQITLLVRSGVHQGAKVEFARGSVLSLGRDVDNDIALTDLPETPTGEYVRLAFSESGRVDIYVIGGPMEIDGRMISADAAVSAPLPCGLKVNNIEIELLQPEDASRPAAVALMPDGLPVAAEASKSWWQSKAVIWSSLTAAAALLVVNAFTISAPLKADEAGLVSGIESVSQQAAPLRVASLQPFDQLEVGNNSRFGLYYSTVQPSSVSEKLSPEERISTRNTDSLEEALNYLRASLRRLGIKNAELSANGMVITVSGVLSEEEQRIWKQVPQDFDVAFKSKYILLSKFSARSDDFEAPLRPSAIWLSDNPYIVDMQGERRYQGDKTADGWTVVAIERSGIKMSRGEHRTIIPLELGERR